MNAFDRMRVDRNAESTAEYQRRTLSMAAQTMRGDWDVDGEAIVSIPLDSAFRLLHKAGWTQTASGRWCKAGHELWDYSEALTLELVAQSL